jgi:hypothetical protein
MDDLGQASRRSRCLLRREHNMVPLFLEQTMHARWSSFTNLNPVV